MNYDFAWGRSYQRYYKEQSLNNIPIDKDHLQPLKFQGQFFDTETSLHYNRFRYYDSDVGMFIQRDPIGLLGGVNVFAYAPNPVGWVDPWGLARKPAGPKTIHSSCCSCKVGFGYRVLRSDEDVSKGIIAKDPTANYSEIGHVLHGSKLNTQYISLSKTEAQAINNRIKYGTPDQRIIQIDLSKIQGSVVDLNSECSPLRGVTAMRRAQASGELLVIGTIPSNAIKVLPI